MWHRFIGLGRFRLLLAKPDPDNYGHLIYETRLAYVAARRLNAALYILPAKDCVNPSIYRLQMDGVWRLPNVGLVDRYLRRVAERAEAERLQLFKTAEGAELRRTRKIRRLPPEDALAELEFNCRIWFIRKKLEFQHWLVKAMKSRRGFKANHPEAAARLKIRRLQIHQRIGALEHPKRHPVKIDKMWVIRWRRFWAKPGHGDGSDPILPLIGPSRIPYYRRRFMAHATYMHLSPSDRARMAALARKLGVADDDRVVTIHMRGSGWKQGREVQDKFQTLEQTEEELELRDDETRNTSIENSMPAIKWLISKGYKVVRLGDPSMAPIDEDGVIDLATSKTRDPMLEVYFVSRSTFMIGSESGPGWLAFLFGTPLIFYNVTNISHCWTLGEFDYVVPKYIRSVQKDRYLSLRETCSVEHVSRLRDTRFFDYQEMTADDVMACVKEMEAHVHEGEHPDPETPEQQAFREFCTTFLSQPRLPKYLAKWGVDQGYLGDARVPQFILDRDEANGCWAPPGHQPKRQDDAEDEPQPASSRATV